ncbi:hypothetical protein [Bradyrhizobium sp. 25ACV]
MFLVVSPAGTTPWLRCRHRQISEMNVEVRWSFARQASTNMNSTAPDRTDNKSIQRANDQQ